MTPHDFRNTLTHLGLSQVGVARVLGVSDRVVRMWIAGDRPIPELVGRVMRLMAAGKLKASVLSDA